MGERRSIGEWGSDLGFVAALGSLLATPTVLSWVGPGLWHEVWRVALTGPLALWPRGVGPTFWELCAAPALWWATLALGMRVGVELGARAGLVVVCGAQGLAGLWSWGMCQDGGAAWWVVWGWVLGGAAWWAGRGVVRQADRVALVCAALSWGGPLALLWVTKIVLLMGARSL